MRVKGEMKENIGWPECANWDTISTKSDLPRNLAFTPDNNVTRRILERASDTLNFKGIMMTFKILRCNLLYVSQAMKISH
jgi:hypothetical protein